MPSSVDHNTRIMKVPAKKVAGLAAIGVVCFFCVLPLASAQTQTTHFRSYSSTHLKSASHVHSSVRTPHSVPSVVPGISGTPSGKTAMSSSKELDQLERASVAKSVTVKRRPSPGPAKSTLVPEKHSAPINFTHKELPQSARSGPAKIR